MKIFLLIILSLTANIAIAQSRAAPDGRLILDTNAVVYNEVCTAGRRAGISQLALRGTFLKPQH